MPDPDLIHRIAGSTGLSTTEAERVINDVLAFYDEPLDALVRRRHSELKLAGIRNEQAFGRIAQELRHRPVAAPAVSERQLRRIVYG